MGLITVIGFRHDLAHEITREEKLFGEDLYRALAQGRADLMELRWGQLVIPMQTVHTSEEHHYRCAGNTLSDVSQEFRSQAAEIERLTRVANESRQFIKSVIGLKDLLERERSEYPELYAHLGGGK